MAQHEQYGVCVALFQSLRPLLTSLSYPLLYDSMIAFNSVVRRISVGCTIPAVQRVADAT